MTVARLVSLSLAALTLAAVAPTAEARIVACGEVITENTVLSNDLDCATDAYALVIGADNVTLDLNGHTVTARPDQGPSTNGLLSDGNDGIVIRNGTVVGTGGLGAGVIVFGSDNRISNVTTGGYLSLRVNGSRNVVANSAINGYGALLEGDQLLLRDSELPTGPGGSSLSGGRQRIVRNTFREAFFAGPNNVIRTNTIGRASLATNASVFARNSGPDQLFITGANNFVARNIVTGGLGIRVVAGAAGNYLRANVALRNEVGFTIGEPSTVLLRNVANDNTGLGIDAVAGVVDGNRAAGNGDPRQCVGVACS